MTYEVVVVGGGLGGLTVAALLASRGVNVCLLERESRPGGCVAGFEKFGYAFDPGVGLYALWQPGEIHDRVFSELPVEAPEVRPLDPAYLVRLPDKTEVPVARNNEQFEEGLRSTFPECADKAIGFYRDAERTSEIIKRALRTAPDFLAATSSRQAYSLLPHLADAARIVKRRSRRASEQLEGTSMRFRRFIDVQLQLLVQARSDECGFLAASTALTIARQSAFSIGGGAPSLAQRLTESIKASGGRIRLDAPVLRLAYDASGRAVGVDLLSGETVGASRAIVSNLTVWDTYGKLIGLNRAPLEVRKTLNSLKSWGVYLLYLGIDESTATKIPNDHILALTDWQENQLYDPESAQFMFASAPAWDSRAPAGKRAATIQTFSDVEEWFTFHEDEEQHEQKDRELLETWWPRIQGTIPELGEGVELIETATPRTFYDLTRRKLGMVGSPPGRFGLNPNSPFTSLPNVFMVGDTASSCGGVAGVTHEALALANRLTRVVSFN